MVKDHEELLRRLSIQDDALVDSVVALLTAGVMSVDEARAVVLNLPPQSIEQALADLMTPPSAGASPAQGNGFVQPLRPTSTTSGI